MCPGKNKEVVMDLILWRHAEAEVAAGGLPDAKRRLTAGGEKQAQQMAAWLKPRLPKRTTLLVSPTERTQQTAHALGMSFEVAPQVGAGAEPADLLAASGWPEGRKDGAVVIVGHQPTLGRLAALLLSGSEADWTIKKGAIWWLSTRTLEGQRQTALRAVVGPDLL